MLAVDRGSRVGRRAAERGDIGAEFDRRRDRAVHVRHRFAGQPEHVQAVDVDAEALQQADAVAGFRDFPVLADPLQRGVAGRFNAQIGQMQADVGQRPEGLGIDEVGARLQKETHLAGQPLVDQALREGQAVGAGERKNRVDQTEVPHAEAVVEPSHLGRHRNRIAPTHVVAQEILGAVAAAPGQPREACTASTGTSRGTSHCTSLT